MQRNVYKICSLFLLLLDFLIQPVSSVNTRSQFLRSVYFAIMGLLKKLSLLGAIAVPIFAQDDSACDPQNDDNNDSTCTGGWVAMISSAANATVTQTSTSVSTYSDSNGRATSARIRGNVKPKSTTPPPMSLPRARLMRIRLQLNARGCRAKHYTVVSCGRSCNVLPSWVSFASKVLAMHSWSIKIPGPMSWHAKAYPRQILTSTRI